MNFFVTWVSVCVGVDDIPIQTSRDEKTIGAKELLLMGLKGKSQLGGRNYRIKFPPTW